jgi:2-C-methyl-D-erythritol 2,4-cyclodiphosphate synthase
MPPRAGEGRRCAAQGELALSDRPTRGIIRRITRRGPAAPEPVESTATPASRVGIGHDIHRLAEGGPLRLGGIDIPHDRHLLGHSDADVLLHAVTDAVLGAAALGDIGEMFPDTDPANRGRDSAEMLREALRAVREAGWQVANVDCIVFAQRPKLGPHKPAMRRRLAEVLAIPPERVGLKAKTGEGVGEIGREEVIAAQCVVLLEST